MLKLLKMLGIICKQKCLNNKNVKSIQISTIRKYADYAPDISKAINRRGKGELFKVLKY